MEGKINRVWYSIIGDDTDYFIDFDTPDHAMEYARNMEHDFEEHNTDEFPTVLITDGVIETKWIWRGIS